DEVGSISHPHLIVGAGKQHTIYLIDRENMGHFNSGSDSQIVQSVPSVLSGSVFSSPAYFNKMLFYQANGDRLKALAITNGALSASVLSQSGTTISGPGVTGTTPSVSANGTNNAIV